MAITVTPSGVGCLNYLREMRTSQGWELIKFNKYHRALAALAVLGMERPGWVWGILWLGWSPCPADPAELGTGGLGAVG